jgi:hypothetical protein
MNPHLEISFTGDAAGNIRYFIRSTLFDIFNKHGFKVTHFTSNVVNFNARGSFRSKNLTMAFPTLGTSLIVMMLNCNVV